MSRVLAPPRREPAPTSADVPTILCIDDDPDVSLSIALRLRDYDVRVERSYFGTQGLTAADARLPDLVLLDLNMPQGRGDYVLARLKEGRRTRGVPVVVLTGERGVERRMLALGAAAVISKPVHYSVLLNVVADHVPLRKIADAEEGCRPT